LQFLSKIFKKKISALNFFQFLVIKTLDPELDPDPDPLNADPQPWLLVPFRTVLLDIKEGFPMALAIPSDFM
jgi:hypothetical protein